jgi:ketosteroid isomerase-like protein
LVLAMTATTGCDSAADVGDKAMAGAKEDAARQQDAVRSVLARQQEAWNRGDIDAFMQDYWQSEQLRFSSGGEVRRGWQRTLERYKQTYPDRAAMGTLEFSDLEVEVIGDDAAVVFGSWRLEREADAPGGLFTLLFKRMAGEAAEPKWVIVADHTSSAN